MCLEFGSCFGNRREEDYGGELSTPKTARRAGGHGRRAEHRNGYHSGTDNKVHTPAYPHQPHAKALNEAGHKAYHDGAWNDHHAMAVAEAGGHGRYAAYVQDRAEYDTPKLPAWHNKVGDNAGYTYTYTPRFPEAASGHKEKAGMDYHHYPTTTTNTTLVRYQ